VANSHVYTKLLSYLCSSPDIANPNVIALCGTDSAESITDRLFRLSTVNGLVNGTWSLLIREMMAQHLHELTPHCSVLPRLAVIARQVGIRPVHEEIVYLSCSLKTARPFIRPRLFTLHPSRPRRYRRTDPRLVGEAPARDRSALLLSAETHLSFPRDGRPCFDANAMTRWPSEVGLTSPALPGRRIFVVYYQTRWLTTTRTGTVAVLANCRSLNSAQMPRY